MRALCQANKQSALLEEHLVQKYEILRRLRQLNPVALYFNDGVESGEVNLRHLDQGLAPVHEVIYETIDIPAISHVVDDATE